MELREWLIILGLVLVTIIVIDGVRRLQRQRKVPRLDQAGRGADTEADDDNAVTDPEEAARQAEIEWELPNGGARVVRSASQPTVAPKPKLQRQEHPGPSKVFSRMEQEQERTTASSVPSQRASAASPPAGNGPRPQPRSAPVRSETEDEHRQQSTVNAPTRASEARPSDQPDDEAAQGRFSRSGMAAAFRSGSQRVSQSMSRVSSAFQHQEEQDGANHHAPSQDSGDADFATRRNDAARDRDEWQLTAGHAEADAQRDLSDDEPQHATPQEAYTGHDSVVMPHPVVEKARRHHVSAQRARETLAHAEEVIVISVMARNEEGFSGTALLDLMLACGLRYSEMGIFLRYETEDDESELQFAMVDVVKPGTFDLEAMDDFATPGVTFLMPLPGARDSAAAFEAMVETAMVLVRNLGGELKDENRSVMTAQTVEFSRQRVQEFERRHRLHRYQAN